jgi:hypothetical protein
LVQLRIVFLSDGLVMQDLLIGRSMERAIFLEMEEEGLATKQRQQKPSLCITHQQDPLSLHTWPSD